jgi:tRNA A64-2'-O-ribosylphosphate transferase
MDVRKQVRRAEKDPWNRLNSILEDADWVNSFCASKVAHLPVVPNLRCGLWYVANGHDKGCYFKSTDGHNTQWGFSLKRYNLNLIHLIQREEGVAIVDSTRRGKSMPDALSKTIPIWCAVVNAASQRRHGTNAMSNYGDLCVPGNVVSLSEEAQIRERLEEWIQLLLSSDLPIPLLEKPLRPVFVSRSQQDKGVAEIGSGVALPYYPIVLVSASQMVAAPGLDRLQSPILKSSLNLPREIEALRKQSRYIYVQGSGDDEEMWSFRLTPSLFWNATNLQKILSIGKGGTELENILHEVVRESKEGGSVVIPDERDIVLQPFNIYLGTRHTKYVFSQSEKDMYKLIIQADAVDAPIEKEGQANIEESGKYQIMRLGISYGKRGLHAFRSSLPAVLVSSWIRV